jgi:radical SAM protein with 4Fe4S-binding SPASM domain
MTDRTNHKPSPRLPITVPMVGPLDAQTPGATPPAAGNATPTPGAAAVNQGDGHYDSRTEAPAYSTAHKVGKAYEHGGAVSMNPNKRSDRPEDGTITSKQYADAARARRAAADKPVDALAGPGAPGPVAPGGAAAGCRTTRPLSPSGEGLQDRATREQHIHPDYRHPLEDYLAKRWMQRLLGYVSRPRGTGKTMIEEVIQSYANPAAPAWQRIKYWPLHRFIRRLKGSVSDETFRRRIAEHRSTLRGFVVTARSVAEFGLRLPQRFSAPLIAIWNFTNQCNLSCRHCYQDAEHARGPDELTLAEKLDLIDQIGAAYVPMMSFAGGEPTISKDLLPVLQRCHYHGIHTSVATNGTTITPQYAAKLAEAGVKYVEISLDSVDAATHDAFRGQPGMWERTVQGMRNVVAHGGLRLGVAMCVHQGNYAEVERMLQFAVDLGASCFAHFNFIPVGRGLNMMTSDLTPEQRERMLRTFNTWMQSGRISILSTAPQLGRVSLAFAPLTGLQSCSHIGGGGGEKARVVAKYLGGCGSGRTYVCIQPDGTITPCVYMPQRVLGNIRNRRFVDIFRHNEFADLLCDREERTGHCEVCEFKYYCGGCRARADAYFGHINAGDPGCIFNNKSWDELLAAAGGEQGAPLAEPSPAVVAARV